MNTLPLGNMVVTVACGGGEGGAGNGLARKETGGGGCRSPPPLPPSFFICVGKVLQCVSFRNIITSTGKLKCFSQVGRFINSVRTFFIVGTVYF